MFTNNNLPNSTCPSLNESPEKKSTESFAQGKLAGVFSVVKMLFTGGSSCLSRLARKTMEFGIQCFSLFKNGKNKTGGSEKTRNGSLSDHRSTRLIKGSEKSLTASRVSNFSNSILSISPNPDKSDDVLVVAEESTEDDDSHVDDERHVDVVAKETDRVTPSDPKKGHGNLLPIGLSYRHPLDEITKSLEKHLEEPSVSPPLEEPKKEVDFTCQFYDDAGGVIATERAIHNPTAERKERGLKSKLAALEKELEILKELEQIHPDKGVSLEVSSTEVFSILAKISDELKLKKNNEYKILKRSIQSLTDPEAQAKLTELRTEIEELDTGRFPREKLITQKIEILTAAIDQAQTELSFTQTKVDPAHPTHGTTDASRYPFQDIAYRDLATKTQAELIQIANTLSLAELEKLMNACSTIETQLKGLVSKPESGELKYREKAGAYLIQIRSLVIPQYIEKFKDSKERDRTLFLINSQLQTVQIEESGNVVSSLGQSGAPSDFAHGEISLQELKDYEELLLLRTNGVPKQIKNLSEEEKQLVSLYDLEKKRSSNPLKAFTSSEVGFVDQDKLSDLLLIIKAKAILSYGENIFSPPPLHNHDKLS